MNLNNEAIKAMDQEPCFFRKERYDVDIDDYEYTCALTTMKATQPHYSETCDPTACPIWKTYVIQVMIAKKLSIGV